MQEDVIPSLKSTLESQEDLSEIELSFQDNRVSEINYPFFISKMLFRNNSPLRKFYLYTSTGMNIWGSNWVV